MLKYYIKCIIFSIILIFVLNYYTSFYIYGWFNFKNKIESLQHRTEKENLKFKSNKWIIVTTISYPTEDLKRLSSINDWNLLVVGDTKTPSNWSLDGVYYLSVQEQLSMKISIGSLVPFKSYTRKNIGYLFAIKNGAEWIFDTDDDNKPHGLGLKQFSYSSTVSGIRYLASTNLSETLFNPYDYFGRPDIWPRGFPLEYLAEHKNGNITLCQTMDRAAVQQGLVRHDPDVDGIYRLLNADKESGLNEEFSRISAPITLSPRTYSPWNSQNTLFNKEAFHTLLLPVTVSFRTTDIWRSYYAQAILHLSGHSVSFVPVNAVQFRNAHNYLKDFENENQVYMDAGRLVEMLSEWNCTKSTIPECMVELAEKFEENDFWGKTDTDLIINWIEDLNNMGYQFPKMVKYDEKKLMPSTKEDELNVNCRRMSISFELVPRNSEKNAINKLKSIQKLSEWCSVGGYKNISRDGFPSIQDVTQKHSKDTILSKHQNNVLVVVNNYPWNMTIGHLQNLYQDYFGLVIFCGSYYPSSYTSNGFSELKQPLNYIHMNPEEMYKGYFGYHCLTLASEIRLTGVDGYIHMADDSAFNIWQQFDFKRVFHVTGVGALKSKAWWTGSFGLNRARNIVKEMNNTNNVNLLNTWKQFEKGLRLNGYVTDNHTISDEMLIGVSRSISDFYYIPSSVMKYYEDLMRIFFKHRLFLELAMNKFLRSIRHQTSRLRNKSYLWGNRGKWAQLYNINMVALHPVKLRQFADAKKRGIYCSTIVQTFADVLMHQSRNYTVQRDDEPDYLNG